MQLEETWRKQLDSSKVSNSPMKTARFAQLTGSQELQLSNLIRSKRTSSSLKNIKMLNLRLCRSQSILRIFPPTAPNSGSARSMREVVLLLPTANQSKCTTQEPCLMVKNSTHQEIADKLSSSLSEEDRLLNAGSKVLLS